MHNLPLPERPRNLDEAVCHSCDQPLGPDNFLPDVCTDCFADCGCLSCVELRQQMAEDRYAEMAFEASRGN